MVLVSGHAGLEHARVHGADDSTGPVGRDQDAAALEDDETGRVGPRGERATGDAVTGPGREVGVQQYKPLSVTVAGRLGRDTTPYKGGCVCPVLPWSDGGTVP